MEELRKGAEDRKRLRQEKAIKNPKKKKAEGIWGSVVEGIFGILQA